MGYVVMPEHMHLLGSEPQRGRLSVAIQVLKQNSSRELRRRARRRNPAQSELFRRRINRRVLLAAALLRLQREDGQKAD